MHALSKLLPALLIVFPAACLATGPPAGEEEVVRATLESWNRGWAEKDVELAIQDYSHDVDWTNAFGDRFEGKEALREGLGFIFALPFVMAGSSEANEYEDVEFLGRDVALLRSKLVRRGQQRADGSPMPDRHIHHLRVLERRDGRWVIVSHLISQAQEKGLRPGPRQAHER